MTVHASSLSSASDFPSEAKSPALIASAFYFYYSHLPIRLPHKTMVKKSLPLIVGAIEPPWSSASLVVVLAAFPGSALKLAIDVVSKIPANLVTVARGGFPSWAEMFDFMSSEREPMIDVIKIPLIKLFYP